MSSFVKLTAFIICFLIQLYFINRYFSSFSSSNLAISVGFFFIVSERKVKKPIALIGEVRIEFFNYFLGENNRSTVKKFLSLRLYYDMTLTCAQ